MHAAAAPSNLDAATTMRSAKTELRNTIEIRAMASEIAAPKPDLGAKAKKKTILKHFLKGFFNGKSAAPKFRKSAADKSLLEPCCSHSNTRPFQYLQTTIGKTHFLRDFLQKVKVEMRKRSFRARLPPKSESGRCENQAFVLDLL